jgi:hypothetical protein
LIQIQNKVVRDVEAVAKKLRVEPDRASLASFKKFLTFSESWGGAHAIAGDGGWVSAGHD